MIFPVTGFPCRRELQAALSKALLFRTGRVLIRDFHDTASLRTVSQTAADDLFIAKAAWLSEMLYRILSRTAFSTDLPVETRDDVAEYLAVRREDCGIALVGLLWLTAANPAMAPLAPFFANSEKLRRLDFLRSTPAGLRLLLLLLDNAASLDAQLNALVLHMPAILSADERHLVRQLAKYQEGTRFGVHGPGPGPAQYTHTIAPGAAVSRSSDHPWMQELILVAKIVPVWLVDLSRRFSREITRLDEIPDAELARLAAFGINGIWLVGLWQRSTASARIKSLTGGKNYASAYSVFDYRVADEWGGEAALERFAAACTRYGIRLGCDMVPNHTGIDSRWLREHPDWFMQSEFCPFPGYTFNGENLSGQDGIATRIEDHYYTQSDAAVVFACDRDGKRRYIYHGNDGTGLPWNDTAQLNHALPEVRQALIETALSLARNFSIIRFDAAMTLTRDHYRRLWFPHPETAPAIPSRSLHGLPAHEFDARMPTEFWSELVAAFRERSGDTLLVAEAFWMTEMYFVRNLGMHRVYNSAFMHALRDEKNTEFETTLRDFRFHDADTLARFANYLSTPDEEAAVTHFPSADKYFGAMTLMATLPGLPLLAPGQTEGYREKYGMDQQAPLLNEAIDQYLAERHLKQIAPLFKQRSEFSDPAALVFPACQKSQNCFVYATGRSRRFLVFFNNSAQRETVHLHGADFISLFQGGQGDLEWHNLSDAVVSQAARNAVAAQGLSVDLAPYQSMVWSDFKAVTQTSVPEGNYPVAGRYYSGVAVPVAALRSHRSCGIGEFADLRLLIDWCVATGQTMVNLLPVNDTGTNSSPYSALSAMALHPVYLSLDDLALPADLAAEVAAARSAHAQRERVAFAEIVSFKEKILRELYARLGAEALAAVDGDFRMQPWLTEYAVFRTLKEKFSGAAWFQWAEKNTDSEVARLLENADAAGIGHYFSAHEATTGFYVWVQYLLHSQLTAVKAYADSCGVYLKGDMPIMLERDSVDVWLAPQLFNHHLRAGAPPDMFSPDGQNWGFPVYNWPEHERENYRWWRSRIRQLDRYFAAYRIDHVLGFFRIWCIEEGNRSGIDGFFLPSQPLAAAELSALLPNTGNLSLLWSVVVTEAESEKLPASARELLVDAGSVKYLPENFLSEQAIASLHAGAELTDELLRRLHSRVFLKAGEIFYPAWDFELKLMNLPGLGAHEKHLIGEAVRQRREREKPLQQAQGKNILSVLKSESAMLPCAEDLGVVPNYVRPTLSELGMLSLKVYRWEAENNIPKNPGTYPYLSLATSSVHDSSNLREWLLTESPAVTGIEIREAKVSAAQVHEFLLRLYRSPSMIVMIPLQDLLALDEKFHGDVGRERINIPGTVSDFNWTYRMPLALEDMLREHNLTRAVQQLVAARPQR